MNAITPRIVISSAATIIICGWRREKDGIAQPQPALAPSPLTRGLRNFSGCGGPNLPQRESDAQGPGVAGRISIAVAVASDPEMSQHSYSRRCSARARRDA